MNINWFPGHMTKALRMMADEVKNIDAIVYVLDARAPQSCLNPSFFTLIGTKPTIFVLNKSDMVEKKDIEIWKNKLKKQDNEVISLNSTESSSSKNICGIVRNLCKQKIEKNNSKGLNTFFRIMVLGVPNCGKSTLINNLVGSAKTITGNKPGVTRGKQWINIGNNVEVLDTPGTLWPKIDNQNTANNLAFIGSIKNEVLDMNELALDFIKFMAKQYPNNLKERYNLDTIENKSALELMEDIAISRKFVLKKNEIDYDRTSNAIIDDFRKGKLGKIILE